MSIKHLTLEQLSRLEQYGNVFEHVEHTKQHPIVVMPSSDPGSDRSELIRLMTRALARCANTE